MEPNVYPRYYRRRPGFSQVVFDHHFYVNEEHSWSEVFYEQVDIGFWLLALEIKGKSNNHYILHPKKSTVNYYSINFFSTPGRIGYQEDNNVRWISGQVSFHGPSSIYNLYQEKDAVFNCCRMIFTAAYLARLINIKEDHLSNIDLQSNMVINAINNLNRITTKAEVFLQLRLFNILKYERGKYHFRPSVYSDVFELTAFFLNYLYRKGPRLRIEDVPMQC
ncbi:hypothetical protein [Mucilaginibacter paludis]|nr:hypothetical protein [Mucilaginibacter paludis]